MFWLKLPNLPRVQSFHQTFFTPFAIFLKSVIVIPNILSVKGFKWKATQTFCFMVCFIAQINSKLFKKVFSIQNLPFQNQIFMKGESTYKTSYKHLFQMKGEWKLGLREDILELLVQKVSSKVYELYDYNFLHLFQAAMRWTIPFSIFVRNG